MRFEFVPSDLGALVVQLAMIGVLTDAARRLGGALFSSRYGGDPAAPPRSGSDPGIGPESYPESYPVLGALDRRIERSLFVAVLALTLAVALVQGLGLAAALRPFPAAAAVALLWLTIRALTREESGLPAPPADPPAVRSAGRSAALAAGMLVGGALAVRALLMVPTEWDGLTYHLFYAAHYLQEASLVPVGLGEPHDKVGLFPGNGELIHTFLMAVVRSDLLVACGMVVCWALFGLALHALARRSGLAPAPAAAVGLLGVTLPALASRAASSYVESFLNLALIVVLLAVHRALTEPAQLRAAATIGGLAAGLAAGTKYVALPAVAVAGLALASGLAVPGLRRRTVQGLGLFAGGALLVGGLWYLRNALVTGNPFFPAPFLGLPYLERPGLIWQDSHLLARWRDYAARDFLGDALFGLPPGRFASASLGLTTLLALPLAAVMALVSLRDAIRRSQGGAGELPAAVAHLLVPAAWIVMVSTYVHLPAWGNDGWFRSGVRFAVPAAALAILLALQALARLGVPAAAQAWIAAVAAVVAVGQAAQAGVFDPLPSLARGLLVVAPPLAIALFLTWRHGRSKAARAVVFALAVVVFFLAWIVREADRERRWSAPGFVGLDFAQAAFAVERVAPGRATIAWAASSPSEFLYLFVGRRLERRVIAVPVHEGPAAAWAYRDGNARRGARRSYWLAALADAGADLVVLSRWRSFEARWPIEDDWAREAGFERIVDLPEFRAYRVPPAPVAAPGAAGMSPAR